MKNANKLLTALILIIIAIGTACNRNTSESNVKSQVSESGEPRLVVQLGDKSDSLAFSHDGKLLVGAGTSGTTVLVVWDVQSGREIKRIVLNKDYSCYQCLNRTFVAFSNDKSQIALLTLVDGITRIFNLENGNLLSEIKVFNHDGFGNNETMDKRLFEYDDYYEVYFDDNPRNINIVHNNSVEKWNVSTKKVVDKKTSNIFEKGKIFSFGHKFSVYDETLETIGAISPDGNVLAKFEKNGIKLEKIENKKIVRFIKSEINENTKIYYNDPNVFTIDFNQFPNLSANLCKEKTCSITSNLENMSKNTKIVFGENEQDLFPVAVANKENLIALSSRFGDKLVLRNLQNGQPFKEINIGSEIVKSTENVFGTVLGKTSFSPQNKFISITRTDLLSNLVEIWDIDKGALKFSYFQKATFADYHNNIISKDEKYIVTESQYDLDQQKPEIIVWDLSSDKEFKKLPISTDIGTSIVSGDFSKNNDFLVGAIADGYAHIPETEVLVWNLTNGKLLHNLGKGLSIKSAIFDSNNTIITGGQDGVIRFWDNKTGQETKQIKAHEEEVVLKNTYSPNIFVSESKGVIKFWEVSTKKELIQMVKYQNGDWIVTTPDGRFDTNNLDKVEGMHWIMPSEPLRPLPIEIFMRQYYEPKLLARVLKCNEEKNCEQEFKPLPSLNTLNRTQPSVKITEVKSDSDGTVEVTVEVANTKSEGQKDTFGNPLESGVNDVRLLRDGQLVGYAPKTSNATQTTWEWLKSFVVKSSESTNGKVELDKDGKATLKFSKIKLPKTGIDKVEFSAYAFNTDQIKSETSRQVFAFKPNTVKGRAYIISLGVNATTKENLYLRYAANDARQSQENLSKRLREQGQYEEVVNIPLISDFNISANGQTIASQDATMPQVRDGQKTVTENTATKAHFKAVLDVLAGKQTDAELLKTITNSDKLRQANPEDLIIISVSSHGFTDGNGIFYLVPSDSSTASVESADFRQKAISSDELSLWLRDVDGGELALVIDACHSASAVESSDFKPAPMNSRGLGQLSYDKGMRILTATQADNVALETNKTRQGLLSYALLQNGLNDFQADFKPQDRTIVMSEWLNFGVERVPKLYEEAKSGQIKVVRETVDTNEAETQQKREEKTQQPSLFDFSRRKQEVTLEKRGGSVPNLEDEAPKVVEPVSTPTPSSSPTTNTQNFNGRVIKTDCRVREYPTTDANIIGKLNYNDPINIVEQRGRWFRVTTATGLQGWMDGDLIEYKKQ